MSSQSPSPANPILFYYPPHEPKLTRSVTIIKTNALEQRLDIEYCLLEANFEMVAERLMEFDTETDPNTFFELFGDDAQFLDDGPVWVYVLERRRAVQSLLTLMPSLNGAIIGAKHEEQAEIQIASLFASSPPFPTSDLLATDEELGSNDEFDPGSVSSIDSAILEALKLGLSAPPGVLKPSFGSSDARAPQLAPTRLRRYDRNMFGMGDGNGTATGTIVESNTTSRDYILSPEKTRASSHSPQDLTNELQGRSRYPITSGGFGDIWKCDLVKPDGTVQVAVKTIRAFESDNEVSMRKNSKRVCHELKVWGRLKHDSILPLWGVANDFGPYPAMVCPWADNGALTGFLERQESILTSHDKFSLLNDIALGLQYFHSKSVVHGDLTGSDVLISGNGWACLADFGLSTIILEFVGTSYFTSSIRGNVRWVAAELCEVSEDEELELQVLTCKVPYYNVKDFAVYTRVIKGMKPEPPKESQIAPGH